MGRALILAGGKGTRLAPYTVVFPKPLMPLGETPVLEVILRQLARRGFEDVTLAVGHLAELIQAYFRDGSDVGVRLTYTRENHPLGTAGPIAFVEGLDAPLLVMNGDVLSTLDYGAFLAQHAESGAIASIATYRRPNKVDFGVVETDGAGRVTGYVEKPTNEYVVSMGVYAFSPEVLQHIVRGETLDFPDLVLRLLERSEKVLSAPFDGYWLDIGRHDDFAQAQAEFQSRRGEFIPVEA